MNVDNIIREIESYYPEFDKELIKKAYNFSEQSHQGQVRATGEPYFSHIYETALIAAQLKLDIPSIISALLHDTIEDCPVTKEDIVREFGQEIADIVEGVTNLSKIEFESKEIKQAENFRKMLIAMAKDIRVILVKLCDRLHNMRTLGFMSEEKRIRKAEETRDIYAPLANRLGLHWLKSELEDLCLFNIRPEVYKQIEEDLKNSQEQRKEFVDSTVEAMKKILEKAGVKASITGRSKHISSIWTKMQKNQIPFEEVSDILGFRVVVSSVRACYETLGILHSAFKPVPGRFKDYIAMPKPNMYQSLHTTLISASGQRIEVQIRTPEMHRFAENGVAAHWQNKETNSQTTFDLQWVKELVESQVYLKNPEEFIQSVKGELFPDEVFIFTPEGDLIRLPFDGTPVDFAYAVHTDVGHTATGAKVNGSMVPLSHKLTNGDTVEIITSKTHVPNKDWLNFVKSSKAKQRIRAFLKSEERAKSLVFGVEMLSKDLKKIGQNLKKLEKANKINQVAKELNFQTEGDLYAEIGYGKIKTKKVLSKLFPHLDIDEELEREEVISPLQRIFRKAIPENRQKVGVKVNGMDNILVRFAKCCEPLPGDRIVGFITRGRGVSVHSALCAQVLNCDPQRLLKVTWDNEIETNRKIHISLIARDRIGLLASVSKAITDCGGDIRYSDTKTNPETQKAYINFELLIKDSKHLEKIKRAVEMIPGVLKVERILNTKK